MLEATVALLALALAAALYALSRARAERDVALARLTDAAADQAGQREQFQALASETLQKNSAQFLELAEQKLAAREATAVGEMDKRRAAVDQMLAPIGEALKKTQDELRGIEKARVEAYAGLKSQVLSMAEANRTLSSETGRLAQALSKPTVRGRYGEIQLQRVAELAGMQSYCDFATQEGVRDASGRLQKPDMVVRLPNERVIAVDAKTNIDAYLEALKGGAPEQIEAHMQRFAAHVADQIVALGRKGYWAQFDAPEFTVMFVPGDQFLDAALERRPDLIEVAARANVVLASPSTLIGLLRAVSLGWREKRFSESALELQKLGKELLERFLVAIGHADKVGTSLQRAANDYNAFVRSVDSRVMPTLRKFEEAGAKGNEPVKELKPVEGGLERSKNAHALDAPAHETS